MDAKIKSLVVFGLLWLADRLNLVTTLVDRLAQRIIDEKQRKE